jgi:hypothetical protein
MSPRAPKPEHHIVTRIPRIFVLATVFAGVAGALTASRAAAQTAGPTIEDLKTPDSPGFVLLGVSPSAIERPSTPKALAVSLLSAVTKGDNLLPSDYAVTVAPYWLVGHSGLLATTYYDPGVAQSLRQTFAISFASAKSTVSEGASGATDLGVGFRAAVLEGHGSATIRTLNRQLSARRIGRLALNRARNRVSSVQSTLASSAAGLKFLTDTIEEEFTLRLKADDERKDAEQNKEDLTARDRLLDQIQTAWSEKTDAVVDALPAMLTALAELSTAHSPADAQNVDLLKKAAAEGPARMAARVTDVASALLTAAESDTGDAITAIAAEDRLRRGMMLSFAGGFASRVPVTGVGDTRLLRWGVWATPSYRLDKPLIDIVGVVRFVGRPDTIGTNLFDFGARIVHQVGSFVYSAEYVQRVEGKTGTSRPTSERLDANVEYKIRDELYLTASFGKNFAGEPGASESKGGLVSILGVNIGLGQKQALTVQ